MPSGSCVPSSLAIMPNRDPGAQGLYKSVSTTENSGLMRNPHEMPCALAAAPNLAYCANELNVMWLLQAAIVGNY